MFKPEGWPQVVPRLFVSEPKAQVGFLKEVFGALGDYNQERPSEMRIGDSLIMVSGIEERPVATAVLYVYVADIDKCFAMAKSLGAETVEEVWDTPYGDRRCLVMDPWGNTWQIATRIGA